MKPKNQDLNAPNGQPLQPVIQRITRRQWLAWMRGAGVALAAGAGGMNLLPQLQAAPSSGTAARFRLPEHPNQNPAYRAWATPDQGVVVWTQQEDRKFTGYRFNANGRCVWRLCDGTRPAKQVTADYAAQTGRKEEEATDFLDQLQKLGVVVCGGYIRTSGAFPTPPEGASYHARISTSDP
jgi:hypothetical protein